ncbi:cellulose synthase subunit BcsC-related outer membrane protein [Vibrio sp. WJH972]
MMTRLKALLAAFAVVGISSEAYSQPLSFDYLATMPTSSELTQLRKTLVSGTTSKGNLIEALIEQGKNAYANYRYDLARGALQRVLAVDPNNIEANYYLGLMAVDSGEFDKSDVILRAIPIDSRYYQLLITYKDIHTQRSSEYQRAKLLAKAGRYQLAREQYQALFSHGIPAPDIAIDYLIIETKIEATRSNALHGLHQLNIEFNNVTRYQIELADHISNSDSNYTLKRAIYNRFISDNTYGKHAAKSWLNLISDLPATERSIADIILIEQKFSDDKEVLNDLADIKEMKVASIAQKRDPVYQAKHAAIMFYDNENYEQAKLKINSVITSGRADAEIYGLLGHIETELGHAIPALKAYKQAISKSQDSKTRAHWQSYSDESEYWTTLALAKQEFAMESYFEAQNLFAQAVTIIPDYAEAYIGLADAYYLRDRYQLALESYRIALTKEKTSARALEGEFKSLVEVRGVRYAVEYYDLKPLSQQKQIETLVRNTKYENELNEFDKALRVGNTQRAKTLISRLANEGISDAWLRRKVALGLIDVGEEGRANALMKRWSSQDKSPEMAHAYSIYLSGLDNVSGAIDVLNQISLKRFTPSMHSTLRRLKLERRLTFISRQYNKNNGIANSQIQNLLNEVSDDSLLRYAVLRSWFSMGETYRSSVALTSDIPMSDEPKSLQLEYLDLLVSFGLYDEFERLSKQWGYTKQTNLSAQQLADWREIKTEFDLRKAAEWRDDGNSQKATALYRRTLSLSPNELSVKLALLSAIVEDEGKTNEAYRLSDDLYHSRKKLSLDDSKTLATLLDELNREDESTKLLYELSENSGRDRQLMSDLLSISVSHRNRILSPKLAARALTTNTRAKSNQSNLYEIYHQDDSTEVGKAIRSDIDTMQAQSNIDLAVGFHSSQNSSRNIQRTIPIEVSFPVDDIDGKFFVRADLLELETGNIKQIDFLNEQSESDIDQNINGQLFGIGFRGNGWSGDIGRLDFDTKSTIVGGITIPVDISSIGIDVTLSRRPMTSTIVSYAGVENTDGQSREETEWGKVTKTGVKVDLSYDQGNAWGAWMSLQYHQLNGDNVEDNHRSALLGGLYHKLIQADSEQLSVSLNSIWFSFDNNQDEFSYGLGGYYSPQSYFSLSVPVSYATRITPKVLLWGGAGVSYSTVKSDGLFNTDEESSTSQSFGFSGEVGIETRLYKHLDLGLRLSHQYSEDYEPFEVQLYSRYYLNQIWSHGDLTPNTVTRYAEFD